MQLILLENISKLGKIGDQVTVKNGFGRNYLLKFNKALRVNKENVDYVNKKKDELTKKNDDLKKKFKEIASIVNNKKISFVKESKDNGELYASLKPREIATLINKKFKTDIAPSQIILKEELNKIGTFKIQLDLFSEVTATLVVEINK
ncbi:MAG: 50S ribosomal protein L9 [Pelagibacteraceae bacterium TMED216]|nr:MAG: 50S ribosomal protein L9 [Pelagibacteraceae bacterium TMED216]|tara:strand:+ start:2577 stop:3020 length:444 start_codon:yes stop_codon:yes gene_type:complete